MTSADNANKQEFAYNSIINITPRPEIVFVKGEGDWLYDQHGERYLDWVQGWAVNCLGHCPKSILDTITQQAKELLNCSPAFYNAPMLRLAHSLTEKSCADQVFFANSGAEANEGAIKLSRKWGKLHRNGAYEFITFQNSFHGRTLATMAATGKDAWQQLFPPAVPGFKKAIFNDVESVRQQIGDKTVAIMLELVQGEGGVIPADYDFVQALKNLAKENGLLLICDEIQTGIARTGTLFGYQHYDIEPDIITLGKGLGGGAPISALMAKEHVCCFEPGDQGGTFNGNPLMTAIGETVLNITSGEQFLANVDKQSNLFKENMQKLCDKYAGCSHRGQGLLLAMELPVNKAKDIAAKSLEQKFIINAPRENTLRFMPALNISDEAVEAGFIILDNILAEVLQA
ncbi:MAG: acetylornithine transaminase [Proteobacteria bacterium]|nr:MAG: acetylornithine transaminase [Pseudomonadota bacterium]